MKCLGKQQYYFFIVISNAIAMKIRNIATLNVRGINNDDDKLQLVDDAIKYKVEILTLSETHIPEEECLYELQSEKTSYVLYSCNEAENHHHGVGFLIRKDLEPNFQRITERIAKATIQLKKRKLHVVAVYAPTLQTCERNPNKREELYNQIEAVIDKIPKRDIVFIAGDFNAKVGSQRGDNTNDNIGQYGKGKLNSSGEALLELCTRNELCITNTYFKHKLCHRTTWTAPMRNFTTHDGTERRNPIRNQIDFIITRKEMKHLVTNSRSYGGINTNTDHKMVIMNVILDDYKLQRKKTKSEPKIDIGGFKDNDKKEKYKDATKTIEIAEEASSQEKWNIVVTKCKKFGEEIFGKRERTTKVNDPTLTKLSEAKQKTKLDISSAKNMDIRKKKCEELKSIKKEMKKCIKANEENQLDNQLKKLENTKNDSNRYYRVMREMQYRKPNPLQIKDENNMMAGTEERKVELITSYFKKMFAPEDGDITIKEYPPTEMNIPFTGAEVQGAAKKLKDGKSGEGADTLHAEYIKHADITIHNHISDIYNKVARTGNYPEELKIGVLTPLQKTNKKQKSGAELDHLRPIMLLSVLRKILTICIIGRIWNRLKQRIPPEQAAYQGGRSTTEQVLSIKLLAEKAINTSNYKIFLSLFDMSKAFDTVNRKKLFEHLERILNSDELHLLSIITNLTKVKVKVNNTFGPLFITLIGIMQGDCLSALLFIFYLAECLLNEKDGFQESIIISPKYADDVTYALKDERSQKQLKQTIPIILRTHNLKINATKTEEYTIPKPPPPPTPAPTMKTLIKHKNDKICWSALDWLVNYKPPPVKDLTPDWKTCKLLGSLLGTEQDFVRRKYLTLDAMNKYDHIFKSKHIGNALKIRTFHIYIGSVFLYNTETWAVNKTLNNKIDSFHRRILRYTINIKWPKKITNEELYKKTKCENWSKTIKRRRLNFVGHVMRLDENTPVRIALKEAITPADTKRGRPKITWIKTVIDDLNKGGIAINIKRPEEALRILTSITEDRKKWKEVTGTLMQ